MTAPRMDDVEDRKLSLFARLYKQGGRSEQEIENIVERVFRGGDAPSRPVAAAGLGAAQGATFNLADEAAGLVSGVMGRGYAPGRDAVRDLEARLRASNPGAFTAGSLAGGLGSAVALGGIPAVARMGAGTAGAAMGALSGFGAGEGASGAALGTVLGGATGGAIGRAAGAVIPATLRGVARARGPINAAAGRVSPVLSADVGDVLARAAARPDATATPAGTALARQGGGAMVPAGGGDVGAVTVPVRGAAGVLGEAPSAADRRILEAMEADALTVEQARALASRYPGVSLPDVSAGEALRREGRRAINIDPATGTALQTGARERLMNAPNVVSEAMERGTGQPRVNVFTSAEDAAARLNEQATPLYEAARAQPFPESLLPQFNRLLDIPEFRRAYKYAVDIRRIAGDDVPTFADPDAVPVPTMQTVDLMKRGVDRAIRGDLESQGVTREMGKAMNQRLRGFLTELDEAVPEYGVARRFYAGGAEVIEAFEEGVKAATKSPDAIAAMMRGKSEAELEAFRSGLLGAARGKMDDIRDTGDFAARLIGTPNARARLRQTFPNQESFDAFVAELEGPAVTGVKRTANAYGGNSTTAQQVADLLAPDARGAVGAGRRMADIASNPVRSLGDAADWLAGRVDRGVAGEVGRSLNLTNTELQALLDRLARTQGPEAARRSAGRAAGRAGASAVVPTAQFFVGPR